MNDEPQGAVTERAGADASGSDSGASEPRSAEPATPAPNEPADRAPSSTEPTGPNSNESARDDSAPGDGDGSGPNGGEGSTTSAARRRRRGSRGRGPGGASRPTGSGSAEDDDASERSASDGGDRIEHAGDGGDRPQRAADEGTDRAGAEGADGSGSSDAQAGASTDGSDGAPRPARSRSRGRSGSGARSSAARAATTSDDAGSEQSTAPAASDSRDRPAADSGDGAEAGSADGVDAAGGQTEGGTTTTAAKRRRRRGSRGRGRSRSGGSRPAEGGEAAEGSEGEGGDDSATAGERPAAAARSVQRSGQRAGGSTGTKATPKPAPEPDEASASGDSGGEPDGGEGDGQPLSASAKRRRRRRRSSAARQAASADPESEGGGTATAAAAATATAAADKPSAGSNGQQTTSTRRRRGGAKPDGDQKTQSAKPGAKDGSKDGEGAKSAAASTRTRTRTRGGSRSGGAKSTENGDDGGPTRTRRSRATMRRREPMPVVPRGTGKLMLITEHGERDQIAVVEDRQLVEHYITRVGAKSMVGNIYLGRVQNVLPGMEAAFIDIGKGRNAVLYAGEVSYDEDIGGRQQRIEQVIKPGQAALVQVTKDPIGGKGPRLTQEISLPGRYVVMVPNSDVFGISRRLPDNERRRLRTIIKKVHPEQHGVIVRTAAEGATEQDLTDDLKRLAAEWEAISKRSKKAKAPALLYEEPELTVRVVRDLFNDEEFKEIVTDSEPVYATIREYLGGVAPELVDKVRMHDGKLPLFEQYHLVEQIHKALERKVWLPSGGYLVIDKTEAMTVIDVNTGKHVGKANLEETVTKTNLEAAEEVARQLRLRDIGGMILIDFIDMLLEKNKREVVDTLKNAMAKDKTRSQVFDISPLGILEVTRKRVSGGLLDSFSETCPTCGGRGILITHEI